RDDVDLENALRRCVRAATGISPSDLCLYNRQVIPVLKKKRKHAIIVFFTPETVTAPTWDRHPICVAGDPSQGFMLDVDLYMGFCTRTDFYSERCLTCQ